MPILRVEISASAPAKPGPADYADHNYEGRAGWKEIVTGEAPDLSQSLTRYPANPVLSPPQDTSAHLEFHEITPAAPAPPTLAPSPAPATPVPTPTPTFAQQQPQAAGTVIAGDYLSRLLQHRQVGLDLILFGMLAALGLGAMHALSPGHGKTIVAAYLVGSRGTVRHAALLGSVVTFTHTFTVFLLGLGVLFFQQYVVPEKIMPVLGAISGLSIVAVGAMLLYRRAAALAHGHSHAHGHHHHGHHHNGAFAHTHDDHTHSHDIPEKLSLGSLVALGVSGGLVPCPSALILMLSSIALGRPGLGLLLLIAFSMGLAAVLVGIGIVAVYAKHLLPKSHSVTGSPAFQLIPIFSAVVVIVLGLAMTAVSAGWIQPLRFLA
jgi:ABC-type nickel/cobalt efflux system permease component RcnA